MEPQAPGLSSQGCSAFPLYLIIPCRPAPSITCEQIVQHFVIWLTTYSGYELGWMIIDGLQIEGGLLISLWEIQIVPRLGYQAHLVCPEVVKVAQVLQKNILLDIHESSSAITHVLIQASFPSLRGLESKAWPHIQAEPCAKRVQDPCASICNIPFHKSTIPACFQKDYI